MAHFVPKFPPALEDLAPLNWVGLTIKLSICWRLLRTSINTAAKRHQLNDVQIALLWSISNHREGGACQNDLASAMSVSSAHISGLVEQLRARGLLLGARPAQDRRCQVWHLTPAGRACLDAVLADSRDWETSLDRQMAPGDARALAGLLDRLLEALGRDWGRGTRQPDRPLPLRAFVPEATPEGLLPGSCDQGPSPPSRYGDAAA
jgi:DNA-binding MarR family transcriptional regulator